MIMAIQYTRGYYAILGTGAMLPDNDSFSTLFKRNLQGTDCSPSPRTNHPPWSRGATAGDPIGLPVATSLYQ